MCSTSRRGMTAGWWAMSRTFRCIFWARTRTRTPARRKVECGLKGRATKGKLALTPRSRSSDAEVTEKSVFYGEEQGKRRGAFERGHGFLRDGGDCPGTPRRRERCGAACRVWAADREA